MVQVTVVIPTYNTERYITQAVTCALEQRHVPTEVIVVDDGSTDCTVEKLRSFGATIRVVQQGHSGPARARNRGAALARGTWLAFLDADDAWVPEKLEKQLALVDAHTHLVYSDRLNVGAADRVPARQSDSQSLPEGDVFEALVLCNFISLSSVLMRRSTFLALGGFDEDPTCVEDWDLWLRYTAQNGRIRVCREPLLRYQWHPQSLSHRHERECVRRLNALRRALASPRGQQLPARLKRQALANVWRISAWYASPTRRWKAAWWYVRSALYVPWCGDVYKSLLKSCLGMA